MKYQTFTEAHGHNRRSMAHLANLIRTRVDRTPAFTLFLGAGASVTSGVRAASGMMEEWRRRLYASEHPDEDFETWLSHQEWRGAEDEYSRLFEMVYDQPTQRRAYIETIVRNAKPNWGYAHLAALLEARTFGVVFTTNFDDLINESCYAFGDNLRPLVCAHDSAVSSIRITSERAKIIKLHGDFLYDSIKNTATELQSLEQNMRDKFSEFAREFGMIVMGYSGNDKSIMDLLDVLVRSDQHFRNGIYWCVRRGECPSRRLRQLLRNDRVFWVEIDGFDEAMASISENLGVRAPLGISAPHEMGLRRVMHLISGDTEPRDPLIRTARARLNETLNKLSRAYEPHGLKVPKEFGYTPTEALELLSKDLTFPKVQAAAALHEGRREEAATLLAGILANEPEYDDDMLWDYVSCLLEMGGRQEEAVRALTSPVAPAHENSTHYFMRALYLLYLNCSKEALAFALKALEMNPASEPAMVQKAISLLQLGDEHGLAECLSALSSDRLDEQYRAAAFALRGDFEGMMTQLHQAIAQRKYTAESAFEDVVFRPYWGVPQFSEKLSAFVTGEPKFRFRDTCPMTAQESALRDRVISHLASREATVVRRDAGAMTPPSSTPDDAN